MYVALRGRELLGRKIKEAGKESFLNDKGDEGKRKEHPPCQRAVRLDIDSFGTLGEDKILSQTRGNGKRKGSQGKN